MLIRSALLLLLIPLVTPLASAATGILIMGDSLSAAYGIPRDQGWVALLQKRLETEGYPQRLVNASISGETTAGALERLPAALERHRPEVVVLELGGNDGLRGLSLDAMKSNLARMLLASRAAGARVLLVGVDLPPNYGSLFTAKFRAVYRDLAAEHQVGLLPSLVADVGGRPALMQADGIHPNAKAQPLLADAVWEQLRPLLDPPGTGQLGTRNGIPQADPAS